MRVLITGNMGYIGPLLYPELRRSHPGAEIWGFDSAYFAHCLTGAAFLPEREIDRQIFGDMREFPAEILDGVDAVIHLGAISNDPMGNRYEAVTAAINDAASKAIAREAKARGVKSFVFASSCSMYGEAGAEAKSEQDALNPLTAYAQSKVAMERELERLASADFKVTALRFATACGMSPRLRLDLVLNDFVACAMTTGKITVLSDGSPWRPLIHVKDFARALIWGIERREGGDFIAVNAGSDRWNYQIKDLALKAAALIPGAEVSINTEAPPDKRSYRVNFALFRELAPRHQPQVDIDEAVLGLIEGLRGMNFADGDFRQSNWMRLKMLESHIRNGALSSDLRWI
ncbi:MAG TPA: SDR family oxidoreductase [Parvularculaceae bacterium]|nr:SDR family oxidoreductase [Parvularculaceae bacterium]